MIILRRFAGYSALLTCALSSCAFSPAQTANANGSTSVAAVTTSAHLVPMPREFAPKAMLPLAHGVRIEGLRMLSAENRFAMDDLLASLADEGVHPSVAANAVTISLLTPDSVAGRRVLAHYEQTFTPEMQAEGYVLVADGRGVSLIAHTPSGFFYAAQTLKQLVAAASSKDDPTLQGCVIRDWPAMQYRGFQDDLSRGPVPTLEFQKREIRTMAAYKVNVFSPYYEHTLQYATNPLAALPGGSMSHDDVRALVEYASHYHMTIVPEQEAFGHLHNVLIYEQYQQLAEAPLGAVLAPGQPGSLDLISQWFTEIAQLFPSPLLHIGADETNELGRGQTKDAVTKEGLGPVYVRFLTDIHARLQPLHRRLLFWGDVAMSDPAAVKTLPKDMIAVAWWYNPEPEGFAKWLKPYLDAGMETWVAPGVNNWSRVYPDNDYALRNIQRFVADGQAVHSTGMINTIWNDDGEGLFASDWYGLLFGAAAGWQQGTSSMEQYQDAYGSVFHGDTTGKISAAQNEMIAAYKLLDATKLHQTSDALYWVDPWSREGEATAVQIRPIVRELRLHAERALTLIAEARDANPHLRETDALDALDLGARRMDFIGQKFESADRLSIAYKQAYAAYTAKASAKDITQMLAAASGSNGLCQDMRNGYSYGRVGYEQLWLRENRPYWLPNVLVRYDIATQLWVKRGDTLAAARSQFREQHTLPTPEEVGIAAAASSAAEAH